MAAFQTPDFLKNCSVDDFYAIIKTTLPPDIDCSEGSHVWNCTRPAALVAARLAEFIIPETIKVSLPEYSYGEYLDGHAAGRGITRREATPATGLLEITGNQGTTIPAGSQFATASINDSPSVYYEATEEATIPQEGVVNVRIRCRQVGVVGNTGPNTIVLLASKITGVAGVINRDQVTGGTVEEGDESLRERIMEYDRTQGDSYVGSAADYKRWATSVPGVGGATIIPAQDDSGLVTIVLTDANGDPATQVLRDAVYNTIMRPDDPGSRLANINALLSVVPPETLSIGIKATVELEEETSLEQVKAAFQAKLSAYLPVAMEEEEVKYSRIGAVLSSADGVADFSALEIGVKEAGSIVYGTGNIPVEIAQLPVISPDDIVLTEGDVT